MPDCEKNILDVPVDLSTPPPTDTVMFTDTLGNTVRRPYSVFGSILPKWKIYDCTGAEGGIAVIPGLANVNFSRIISIEKNGAGYRDILETVASGADVQYTSDGTAGTVTQPSAFFPGEWVKVIYI